MDDKAIFITSVIAIFGTIIGLIYWIIKSRDKLVYKDVCEAKHKGFEDCVEAKLETLETKIDEGFKRLEGLINGVRGQ